MSLLLKQGERLEVKGRTVRVTQLDADVGPRVRDYLIEVARRRQVITYGELRAATNLPHIVNGIGRLLDVLSEDCKRRGEPSLAPVVVNAATNEVGSQYAGHPSADRDDLYAFWA